jgi:arginyl-tRNA synthetase
MNLFRHFLDKIRREIVPALVVAKALPEGVALDAVTVEPPRDPSHGDISTNAALVLAKGAGMPPRKLAEILLPSLKALDEVAEAEVAGPGFINLRLKDSFWHARLADILRAGTAYGDGDLGAGKKVNIEFVSANPTGPMHVGHGRGAVVGDALASLLEKVGFAVTREYYVNDAGGQVGKLGFSLHRRYLEALGKGNLGEIPEDFYPGDYLKETAAKLVERDGRKWDHGKVAEWLPVLCEFAAMEMLDLIRADLALLGIVHETFVSERRDIVEQGKIEAALKVLDVAGLVYVGVLEPPKGKLPEDWEPREQTLFRSTQFGDDVDRPLRKSDGTWTYFAADIAYHFDKFQRGFADMIDVWGADHGGYVKRVQAAVTALTGGQGRLDVKLCQLVSLSDHGVPVKMSKRAGTFVTLREVVEQVGKDVFRFVMLTRRNDQALEFDFAKVVEQSKDNPVFYVQYAHARARSVLRLAAKEMPGIALDPIALARAPLHLLVDSSELALIRVLAGWPRLVESAADAHEPHRIAFFLQELASNFHALWNKGKDSASLRFVVAEAPDVTAARLALVQAVAFVVGSGLKVFGVEPAEEMR